MIYTIQQTMYIPKKIIEIFLSLCPLCAQKKTSFSSRLITKPIVSDNLNARGQVDLIDLRTNSVNGYNWLLNYQDHHTKFTHLRPLKSKHAAFVAFELFKIFSTFGAPRILQSDNGKEFVNQN